MHAMKLWDVFWLSVASAGRQVASSAREPAYAAKEYKSQSTWQRQMLRSFCAADFVSGLELDCPTVHCMFLRKQVLQFHRPQMRTLPRI